MTLPPQVSVVLLGTSGFCGLHPRTVISPPVLAPAAVVAVSPLSPLPQPAASRATADRAATATVRVVPRMDVLLRESGVATRWSGGRGRELLPIGRNSQCIALRRAWSMKDHGWPQRKHEMHPRLDCDRSATGSTPGR